MTTREQQSRTVLRVLGGTGTFLSITGLALAWLPGIPPLIVLDLRVDRVPLTVLMTIFGVSVFLLALSFLTGSDAGRARGGPASFAIPCLFGLLFGRILLSALVWSAGFTFPTGDDFCRMLYGWLWSQNPFFAPPDHIWLGGHFCVLGTVQALMGGDPVGSARVVSLSFSLATLILLFMLTRRLFDEGSALAAVTVAVVYHHMTWLSLSALGSMITTTTVLGWALLALRAEETHRLRDELAASIMILLGTTIRYEIHLLAVVQAALLVRWHWHEIWGLVGARKRSAILARVVTLAALPWLYQVAWMIDADRVLGHPLAHFSLVHSHLARPDVLWDRLLFYPHKIWESSGILAVALPAATLWVLVRRRNRQRILIAASSSAYLLLVLFATMYGGAGQVLPIRVPLPGILLFFPFLGYGVATAIRWGKDGMGTPRRAAAVVAGLLFLAFLGWESARGFAIPTPEYVSSDMNETGRFLSDRVARGVWSTESIAGFLYQENEYAVENWTAKSMCRRPADFAVLAPRGREQVQLIRGRGKDIVVIVRSRDLPSPAFELAHSTHFYNTYVWHAATHPDGLERILGDPGILAASTR